MTFEISQAVMLERAIVVFATIVAFGVVSIGGLCLLRWLGAGAPKRAKTEQQARMELMLAAIRTIQEGSPGSSKEIPDKEILGALERLARLEAHETEREATVQAGR